jgi:putative transposase
LGQLRQLREENGKLKGLVADLSLDRHILQETCKQAVKPRPTGVLGLWTQPVFALSGRRAAGLMNITRKTLVYRCRRPSQDALRMLLRELAASRVRFGYRRPTVILRREGWRVNPKRICRLYTEDGLTLRTKIRKKLAGRSRVPMPRATRPNQKWSMDFMSAKIVDGRWFRVLTLIDQFIRECLALLADRALNGYRGTPAFAIGGGARHPESITAANGSEIRQ